MHKSVFTFRVLTSSLVMLVLYSSFPEPTAAAEKKGTKDYILHL
jgi:hypothetical protein